MKETELFEPTKKILLDAVGCDAVYAEVIDIDVVGKKGNYYIGVEMKTSLNFKVIEQAHSRIGLVDYVFIMVPKPKQPHSYFIRNILKDKGIGLMYYYPNRPAMSCIQFWGKRHKHRGRIAKYIDENLHTITTGGAKGGGNPTAYSLTMDKIKRALFVEPKGLTIEELLEKVETHYANPKASTSATLRAKWNEKWIAHYKREDGKLVFVMREDYRNVYQQNHPDIERRRRR